ncbi:cell wall / vacuolar inhibitor of fructosidase 2-like [Abrus precatorius]|uniref:Cell wall / vacuolar inhibitor of fructosidase 2-like n=1 Tax=Abrus precatorius TaxID=3816 RepID=A0A8B8K392_ABRPR|nr:cell wall / vacuolar inhibitor of fructosidase 2-like [Abrus precatorius]
MAHLFSSPLHHKISQEKKCKNIIKYHPLCCFVLLVILFIHPSYASNNNVTKLVDEVCGKTSNYTFCIESLYSDPNASESDSYGLAYVAFRLAYLNATNTRDYIRKLLNKATSSQYRMHLQRCAFDYEKAISAIETAYNDLNSETFFELADLAGVASHGAEDCQATFRGTHHCPLCFMNNALEGLCQICVVISKLFTGS